MTIQAFKLPRKHLPGVNLKRRGRLASAPRPVPPPEEDPSGLELWTPGFSSEAAVVIYDELGIRSPERPLVDPCLPASLPAMAHDDIGELYGQFVAFTGWIESEVALAETRADETESYFDHVTAEVRLRKAGTVADKDAKTRNDKRVMEAEQAALIAKAKAKLLKTRYKDYERCSAALSREMTRRGVAPER